MLWPSYCGCVLTMTGNVAAWCWYEKKSGNAMALILWVCIVVDWQCSGMGIVLGSADFRCFLIDFQRKKKNQKKKYL